jgi:hypothetical protein
MAGRRLSRGTPLLYGSKQEQEAGVKAIDADPEVVRAIEQITGKAWSALAFGDKVAVFDQHNEMGAALAQVVAVERTRRDLLALAADRTGDIAATERLTLVEAELAATRDELRRTQQNYEKLRGRAVAETAAPAMAVHS